MVENVRSVIPSLSDLSLAFTTVRDYGRGYGRMGCTMGGGYDMGSWYDRVPYGTVEMRLRWYGDNASYKTDSSCSVYA